MTDFTALKASLSALVPDELQKLVVDCEEAFGVKVARQGDAAAQVIMHGITPAPTQTEFAVELSAVSAAQKINTIKMVRELTNLDLKSAKDLVDGAPRTILENLSKDQAEAIKAKLETVGATVVLK